MLPMAHFNDLSTYEYLPALSRPNTKNVGWLSHGRGYEKQVPDEETLGLVWSYCQISIGQTRGIHLCDLCLPPKHVRVERQGLSLSLGSAEIRVLSKSDSLYAAPNLIYHYMEIHKYRPPDEFLQALKESPAPPNLEYFGALKILGLEWSGVFSPQHIQSLQHELDIYRELIRIKPVEYAPELARTLCGLGFSYRQAQHEEEAEKVYKEGLNIYRELANRDPMIYLPDLARTLNRLADIYRSTEREAAAKHLYDESAEALAKWRSRSAHHE